VKFPDTPLILAGALGGPFCIFFLTPLRNALTLASQDVDSTAWSLYQTTFAGGFASGWTGGFAPVLPSCPQFCVLGPLFHFFKDALGSTALAVLGSASAETMISYGSQTLNSQMAYNRDVMLSGVGTQVPLWNPLMPFGPGVVIHVVRNIVAFSGIRIFSRPCQEGIARCAGFFGIKDVPLGLRQLLGDFVASMGGAVLSAPLNQLYNFAVTSEAYIQGDAAEKVGALCRFLDEHYLTRGPGGEVVGLSPTLARDLIMRCAYVATLYSIFGAIERALEAIFVRCRARRAR